MVRKVSAHHLSKPFALLWNRRVYPATELFFDLTYLVAQPIASALANEQELPRLAFPADVGKAKKRKCFRLPNSAFRTVRFRVLTKFNQPRLLRV